MINWWCEVAVVFCCVVRKR